MLPSTEGDSDKSWTSLLSDFKYLYRTVVHINIKILALFLYIFIFSYTNKCGHRNVLILYPLGGGGGAMMKI
jgi:hypothetical protein